MNAQPLYTAAPMARRPSWAARKPALELDYLTLNRLLHGRGCEYWHESVEAGDRSVYFCKRRRV